MKLTVYVHTNHVGSRVEQTIEVDDESLEGLSESERQSYLEEEARDAMWNLIEWGREESE